MTPLSAWWISKVAIATIGMVGFLGIGVSVILITAQLPPKGVVEKLDTAGLYGTAGSLLAMPIILVLSLFLQTRLPSRHVATKLTHKDEEKGEPDTRLPQPVPAQGGEDTASNENHGSQGEEESGRYSEITSGDEGAPDVRPSATLYEESPAESDYPRHVKEHVPASFLPLRSQRPSYSYYTSPYSGTDHRGSRNQQHRLNTSNETRLGVRSADESYSLYTAYPSYQEVDDQEIPAPTQGTTHQVVHDQDEPRNSIAKPGTQPINAGSSDDSYWVHTDIGLAKATPPLTFLSPHQEAHNQELSEGDISSDNFYPSIQDMVQYYPTTGETEDKVTDRINQKKQLSKSTNRNSHRTFDTFDLAKTGVTADGPVKKPCMVNKRVGTDPESQPWIFTTGDSSTRLNEDGSLVHKWVEPVAGAGIATPKKVRFQIDDDESSECEFVTAESSPDGKKECLKIGKATGVKFKQ